MIFAIVVAFVITIVLIALGELIQRKLTPTPIPAEWVWVVWVVVVLLIAVAWWNLVVGPRIGPIP